MEVDVLGYPSLIVRRVSVDVKLAMLMVEEDCGMIQMARLVELVCHGAESSFFPFFCCCCCCFVNPLRDIWNFKLDSATHF